MDPRQLKLSPNGLVGKKVTMAERRDAENRMANKSSASNLAKDKILVFRKSDTVPLDASGLMEYVNFPVDLASALEQRGLTGQEGNFSEVLFKGPIFSLIRARFESNFPLPPHSHDKDCLYYVTKGSLYFGNVEIGEGEGFLVPANIRYSYRPGPEGVEVLEFRNEGGFDMCFPSLKADAWQKLAATIGENKDNWERKK